MIPWGFAAAASLSNRPTSGVQLFVKPTSEAAHCAATTRGGTARPVMTAPLVVDMKLSAGMGVRTELSPFGLGERADPSTDGLTV
ncbi:hypothetical protein GCM10022284_09250 [Streptomyces hundungensis]